MRIPEYNTRERVKIAFNDPSLTEQSHKQECDINHIISRFTNTGQMPAHLYQEPQYGNAPNLDLKTAMDIIKNMREEFNQLSDDEKAVFDNNSDKYAQFLSEYAESPESFIEPKAAEPSLDVQETLKEPNLEDSDPKAD